MKLVISYPPLDKSKGCPMLGQNRQFQYFREPAYIYPVIPAQAATMLKGAGHEVIWNDCIAQDWNYQQFLDFVKKEKPDLIAFETKTPVIKQHWKIIDDLKKLWTMDYRLWTVLFGDHVTALPEESFQNSQVDFVLTGGDYDFLLLNLCNYLSSVYKPVVIASPEGAKQSHPTKLEPGIWYCENLEIRNTGKFQLNHDLNSIPFIDRDLTKWQLYAHKNGNFKRTPGTYIMSARDCWWGKCSFCSWPQMYPEYRSRSVENVLDEIGDLIARYKVREIMDDSGSFPAGVWLKDFCKGMISRGYHKKVYLDCNMRFGALDFSQLALMKKAGFRLLLYGLESANQKTLDRINKKLKVERITQECRLARRAGLFPHITVMFGYPWESYEDALNTLQLGRWLLTKGYAYTAQATLVVPYPGTHLFEECRLSNRLKTVDWDDYDMKQPVMESAVTDRRIMELIQEMYKVSYNPEFIFRKLLSLRDLDDLKYFTRAAKKVIGHVFDFRHKDIL